MYKLRDYQEEAVVKCVEYLQSKTTAKGVLVAPTGCHAIDYELLKSSGEIVKVQDIKVGDELLGPDGTARRVLELHRGRQKMYRITLRNKTSFVVNEGHLLQLYNTSTQSEKGYFFNSYPKELAVTVKEYLGWAKSRKHQYKIKRAGIINFSEKEIPIDPYFLGLWLGDGTNKSVSITTPDKEIKEYIYKIANEYEVNVRIAENSNKTCPTYFLTKGRGKLSERPLRELFKQLDLFNNKHIPYIYRCNSIENRVKLLEGLIDTDGSLGEKRARYEITVKEYRLARDIYMLANSLGLQASLNSKISTCQSFADGEYREYFRVCFRWSPILRPKLERKRLDDHQFKNEGHHYSFTIEELEEDNYYGFTLDGDNLYVDTQHIIHHNSGKSIILAEIARRLGGKTIIFQPSKELLAQNYEKYTSYGLEAGIYSASFGKKDIKDVTFATIGSVKSMGKVFKEKGFTTVLIDECDKHSKSGSMLSKFIKDLGATNVLGCTATPIVLRSSKEAGVMARMIDKARDTIFSRIVHVIQIQELTEKGYWSPLEYEVIDIDRSQYVTNSTGADFTEISLNQGYYANDVEQKILESLDSLRKDGHRSILVFMPTIDSARKLSYMIEECEVIYSGMPVKERDQIVSGFKSGDIPIVANVNILSVGFDYPEMTAIILARPTNSIAMYYQQLGRLVRIHPDKKFGKVIDISGNHDAFGRIEDFEFIKDSNNAWDLYSKDKKLTGISLREEIERSTASSKKKRGELPKLWFGKHEGKPIRYVPSGYLNWMMREFNFRDKKEYKKIIANELERRRKYVALNSYNNNTTGQQRTVKVPTLSFLNNRDA